MGQIRKNFADLAENGQVGDWCFTNEDSFLWLRYPDGSECGDLVHLPISRDPQATRGWFWNGDREAPTLEPSINVIGKWHGFLRAGKLETV
jgi:hypothetical protein